MFGSINGKKLAGVVLAGVITLTGVTFAFAADQTDSSGTVGQDKPAKMDFSKMTEAIDSALDKLVTAGTITQAQSDAVSAAMKAARDAKTSMEDALKALVTKGTITQAQLDKISAVMKPGDGKGAPPQGERKDPLADLVTAGTLTQAQADKVNAAVKEAMDALRNQ